MRGRPRTLPAVEDAPGGPAKPLSAYLRTPLIHLQFLLVVAVVLGGGGAAYGLRNLVIQLVALAILVFNSERVVQFARLAPKSLVALVVISVAIPVLQAVPVPADFWQALPGRGMVVESFSIAGLDPQRWFSASVSPMRTLVAFSGTIVPFCMIVVGCTLRAEERIALAWSVVAIAVAALLLGAIQLSSANTFGLLFDEGERATVLYTTFANRNSTAIFFVLALCLLAGMPRPGRQVILFSGIAAAALLFIGTFLTQSRTGMVLLAVPVGLLALRFIVTLFTKSNDSAKLRSAIWGGLASAAVLAAVVVGSATSGGRVATSIERFSDLETDRPEMWEDGIYAAGQYWPVGSGMGTADDVFQIHESLEYVSPRRAGRVHNDYIELAIEGGLVSLAMAALWLAWAAFSAFRPGSATASWMRLGAGAGVGAIALQSLMDYPLRNQTILCVVAVLVILLAGEKKLQR